MAPVFLSGGPVSVVSAAAVDMTVVAGEGLEVVEALLDFDGGSIVAVVVVWPTAGVVLVLLLLALLLPPLLFSCEPLATIAFLLAAGLSTAPDKDDCATAGTRC